MSPRLHSLLLRRSLFPKNRRVPVVPKNALPSSFYLRPISTSPLRSFSSQRLQEAPPSRESSFPPASATHVSPASEEHQFLPQLYRSQTHNILENFALEHHLVNSPHSNILFLWTNDATVTIGRHQNPWSECRLAELEKDNVMLVRRHSGGGAILQDRGCLTFSIIADGSVAEGGSANFTQFVDKNFALLVQALENVGLEKVARKGRNDIVVEIGRLRSRREIHLFVFF